MPRDGYLWFIGLFVIVVPLFWWSTSGYAPQCRASRTGASADAASPARRAPDPATTPGGARTRTGWASRMVVFLSAVHLLLVAANLRRPAQLPEPAFLVALGRVPGGGDPLEHRPDAATAPHR